MRGMLPIAVAVLYRDLRLAVYNMNILDALIGEERLAYPTPPMPDMATRCCFSKLEAIDSR